MRPPPEDESADLTSFEAMTELCIEAAQAVERHGTPRLFRLLKPFLYELALETVRRAREPAAPAE